MLKLLVNDNLNNYYDLIYQSLSKSGNLTYSFTNGLKWTEIDDIHDLAYAKSIAGISDRTRGTCNDSKSRYHWRWEHGDARTEYLHQVEEVTLYGRRQEVVDSVNNARYNKNYFPGLRLNPNIRARLISNSLDLADCEAIIIAIPSSEVRSVVNTICDELADTILITVAKGLEYPSLKTMSDIILEESKNPDIVSFSGPNFADEIAYGHIAGATIGTADASLRATMSDSSEDLS